MTLASFNAQYRFGFINNSDEAPIETSTYQPTRQESSRYQTLTLDEFNQDMIDFETRTHKAAVVLSINDQPREITELLTKISEGKYGNFVRAHLDNVVLGRNFQKKDLSGYFAEELGATANKKIGDAVKADSQARLGFIDTYNAAFNSVDTETAGDEVFTRFAQVISVFMNEIKESYYQSKGEMKEDSDVYTYVKEALTATKDYIDKGGNLNFVKSTERTIFSSALQLMSDNVDAYLKTLEATKHLSITFTGIA
jgi:hypothetical protein